MPLSHYRNSFWLSLKLANHFTGGLCEIHVTANGLKHVIDISKSFFHGKGSSAFLAVDWLVSVVV